jgi:CRP-like cAMP-binding protein
MSTLNKSPQLTEAQYDRFNEVLDLAQTCGYEEEHTQQVARLALQIFDQLRGLTIFRAGGKIFPALRRFSA